MNAKVNIIFFMIAFLFQSCTYLLLNPPQSKKEGVLSDPLVLLGLLTIINNSQCKGNGKFWARNIASQVGASYCVESKLVGSANGADFYLENTLSPSIIDFNSIISEYNTKIYPNMLNSFGPASDIDKDGKIVILTLDIKDGATPSSGFIAGFVDPVNFTADNNRSVSRSNQMEILYMDGAELVKKRNTSLARGEPDPYLATLAHELQHLIRFQYSAGGDPTWVDEGTSEVASDLTGYGPQVDRIKCFKGTGDSACPNEGVQGTSPFNWGGTLQNYAYSYAFMRYLYLASGSTRTEQSNFLLNTLKGTNGNRANSALGLMEVFKLTPSYTGYSGSNPVLNANTSSSNLFTYLFTYFMGRTQGYTDFSSSNTKIVGTSINLSDLHSTTNLKLDYTGSTSKTYTLPSGITDLSFQNNSSNFSGTNSFSPGVVARRQTFSGNPNSYVKSSGTEYITFNPNPSGSSISQSLMDTEEPIVLHEGANCITPQLFLNEVRIRANAKNRYLFPEY